jgi:DNA-binding beta-propeller fold protein YncE
MNLKYVLVPILSLVFGCTGGHNPVPIDVANLTVYPSPPDSARIQFLTSISSSADVAGKPSFLERYVLGDETEKMIHKPYGITSIRDKIYVCDTMLPGLEIIDLSKKTFDYFTPSGSGQLQKPVNCAIDDRNRIYVADTGRRQIVIFSADGIFVNSIGDGINGKPTDVCVYRSQIYICDLEAHMIKVYDMSGDKMIREFPVVDKNYPQYLFSPTNIFVFDNKIYVTDTGDARIKVFTIEGEYEKSIGSFGKQPGQFVRPKGLQVDPEGNLFVVDAAFENIQIFDDQDRLLLFFGGRYNKPGSMWLPAGVALDANNLDHFSKYVYNGFNLQYLILMTNQYGPDKINIYGFIN